MNLLIGASGRARHGKTIFCEAILNYIETHERLRYDLRAKMYDVGDMIRLLAVERGLLPADITREKMTKQDLQVLIDLGKEMRRVHNNYWVEALLGKVQEDTKAATHGLVALCPNLRLPVEAEAFRAAGGYVVRCTRLNADGSLFISDDRPPNDITETALQFWPADYYLTTSDGQEDFMARQAITTYEYIRGTHGKHK